MQPITKNPKATTENYVPRLSIGLPVYNGEKYLAESIESVLAQDFDDFDFLISDNCSTDSTWEICQEYALKDPRVRIHKHERNFGAIFNFEYVFLNTSSPYFSWHAHDDFLSPTYIGKCYHFLEENSDYVLCFSRTTFVDEDGKEMYSDIGEERIENNAVDRFKNHWFDPSPVNRIYGLIRRDVLNLMVPFPRVVYWLDWIQTCELALAGKSHLINEVLRFVRYPTSLKANLKMFRNHGPQALLGSRNPIALLPYTRAYMTLLSRIRNTSLVSEDVRPQLLEITRAQMPLRSLVSKEIAYYRSGLYAYILALLPNADYARSVVRFFRRLRNRF